MAERTADNNEVKNLKGKLNVMSAIMRLGHEAFRRKGLVAVSGHIVNNSRLVVRYDRSALVDLRTGKARLITLIGQSEPSVNSEYSTQLLRLAEFFPDLTEKIVVTEELLAERQADATAMEAFRYLSANTQSLLLLPLREPNSEIGNTRLFLWVVEFFEPMPPTADAILALLAESYNEAVWSTVNARREWFSGWFKTKGKVTPVRVFQSLVLLFVLALIFGRINQNVAADFEVVPQDKQICYAPYDGVIKGLEQLNGRAVNKGSVLISYDTDELRFKLADAQKSFDETSAKADLIRNTSFTDNSKLGDIKLLEIQKEKEKINIEKMQWYLSRSKIVAGYNGIFVVENEDSWNGKAVRAGDELCQIFNPEVKIARVMLNERDASVLEGKLSITLYLHTRPESPMTGEIDSISPKPLLQKNGQFCYIIKIKMNREDLIFGMRGVARVSGGKVSLGYYLFRNVVLWWRRV